MSIANGKQQKRLSKKQSTISTAAVYPILHTTISKDKANVSDSETESHYVKGQRVRGQPVPEQTIVSSVAEFVNDVIPQGSTYNNIQNEFICWIKIQKCACDFRGRTSIFIIVIGLSRGYQIWVMLENGDFDEVVSERKGPLRIGHLLPFTTSGFDLFQGQRPLFAMVDGNPMSLEQKHCSVSFLSLSQGKIAYSLDFSDPIIELDSSASFLLIVFAEKLVICDENLTKMHTILIPPACDPTMPPCYALSDNFLAFSEFQLDKQKQSFGGAIVDDEISYSKQMMNAAKSLSKTVSSIGESFVSSFTSPSQSKSIGATSNPNGCDSLLTNNSGIVSVINVNNVFQTNGKLQSKHYLAHFVAFDNFSIGHLAFGNGGQLLLAGSEDSTIFNLFVLHIHPTNVSLSSVQHIYTLHRGTSAAKVVHTAFSTDNRWLSIATNHGTIHIFSITPYGGPVNSRTHCGKFVNKESRFQRSVGMTSLNKCNTKNNNVSVKPVINTSFRENPAVNLFPVMSKVVENPRLTFYSPPIQLYSVAKIKQHAFSAENFTAWASDNTPAILSVGGVASGRQNGMTGHYRNLSTHASWPIETFCRKFAVIFDSSDYLVDSNNYGSFNKKNSQESNLRLYVMNINGVLIEYKINTRSDNISLNGVNVPCSLSVSAEQSSQNALSTTNIVNTSGNCTGNNRVEEDVPVNIKINAVTQWILKRNRSATNVEVIDPPLSKYNTLMQLYAKAIEKKEISSCSDHNSTESNQNLDEISNSWLQQIEVITYSGPHRRLWMGPQFSFGIYASSDQSSTELFNLKENESVQEKTTFPTLQKCCPVLIEKNPINSNNFVLCDNNTLRIVCGSWSSDIVDIKTVYDDENYASVKEKIEDAMRDVTDNFEKKTTPKKNKIKC